MPNYILNKPIVFPDGTGFDVEPNDEILPLTRRTITFANGQPVASSSNVTFDNLNAASKIIIIDDDELVLSGNVISGSFTQTGDFTTSDNFTLNGDWNVDGTIIAEKLESELTQSVTIYESGSTLFGDTLNDLHDITGSLLISGSIYLNDNQSNEISNDILFNDSNLLTLVTENAIKTIESTYTYLEQVPAENRDQARAHLHRGEIHAALESARLNHDVYHFFRNH